MCPQIFGMYTVKLSVVLVIIGGVPKLEGNMRVRGQCHLLLVGEPGTGKSQILKVSDSSAESSFERG
jgi:DNA helicase MCM9